tara:strand:- start:2563 stop:2736 length:174 start_codon:yes stop_codon:yes gene_type:complete
MKCERCDSQLNADSAVWLSLEFESGRWQEAKADDVGKKEFVFAFGKECAKRALEGSW